ncbi:MAG: enoyl-CoA hydratase-related protein, partial [Pseudomonadota bacterium]
NALSGEMVDELLTALDAIAADPDARGVTLRGEGKVFCAGGDLKGFAAALGGGGDHAEVAAMNKTGGELFQKINELPKFVLILVQGAAMAGGLGMVCAADAVAVTRDAKFALTETTLGIPPAQIAPFVAARLGLRTARRLMLTAARFDGEAAGSMGLADWVVDDVGGLDAMEEQVRADVMRCAPGANAVTKDILLKGRTLAGEAMQDYAADGFARCLLSDEGKAGIQAFVAKSKPYWVE